MNGKESMAQQIAQAAIAFEQRRTGNKLPKAVTVVLSEGTLVITLHEALTPAEKAMAQTPERGCQSARVSSAIVRHKRRIIRA